MRDSKGLRFKLVGLVCVIGLLISFGHQCSPRSSQDEHTASHSRTLLEPSPTPQIYDDAKKMEEDAKNRYESVLLLLDRESQKLGIPSLRTRKPDSGNEIRVWIGFGLAYPRCFIFERQQERREATFVGPRVTDGRAAKDTKGKVLLVKSPVGVPRSGWSEFESFLKQMGIDSPISLAVDKQYVAVPDAETNVIEIRSQNAYSMVFYSLYTKSEDGLKALEVCRKIEEEFGITMGCGAQK